MTFRDLQKVIESQPDYSTSQQSEMLQRLSGKAFWYWDSALHKDKGRTHRGDCCFNHIISLPKKNGVQMTMFEYERSLYKALTEPNYLNGNAYGEVAYKFKVKHLWVKKSTGIGATEFFLRFMAWLCLYNDDYRNSQMIIITGPNIDLAIKLIRRMKALFLEKLGVTFDTKETVLNLNGCEISAYPSNHIDSARSLTNPKFILIDECDFLPKFQQEDARAVAERYIAKSDPFIVLVSTPNAPNGLFEKIEKESFDTCIYKKMFLDYTYGVGKIYTQEEIDKASMSPSFEREYISTKAS